MPDTQRLATSRTGCALLALGVGAIALAVRCFGIGEKSIWLDEAWSWRAARLSLPDMVDWTAQDRHPPAYYAVLSGWVAVVGDAEWALRAPSAVAGALTAALLAVAAWRIGGAALAAVAGGLLALHPTAIEFSQEARMYPLAGLLALGASVALAAAIVRPSVARFGVYALVATVFVYTHYSAFFALALQGALLLAYAWVRHEDRARILRGGAAAGAVIALAYAPWYQHLLASAREGVGHLAEPSWSLADVVLSSQLGLQSLEGLWLAVALPLVGFGAWGVVKRAGDPLVTSIAGLALVPFMQLAYAWLRTPVLDPRQASPYVAGAALIAALGVIELGAYAGDIVGGRRTPAAVAGLGATALAAVFVAGAVEWYRRPPREDWRAAAAALEETAPPALIWRSYIDEPLRYYTDHAVRAQDPSAALPGVTAGAVVLSHETAEERGRMLAELEAGYRPGAPRAFEGITVIPLTPR